MANGLSVTLLYFSMLVLKQAYSSDKSLIHTYLGIIRSECFFRKQDIDGILMAIVNESQQDNGNIVFNYIESIWVEKLLFHFLGNFF